MANNEDLLGLIELDRALLGRRMTLCELMEDIYWLDVFDRGIESQLAARAGAAGRNEELKA